MSDTTLNAFVAQGTDAERLAFTPSPPTPAAGPDSGYYFFVNDTTPKKLYAWDSGTSAWVLISSGGAGTIPTTAQGDLLYASAANTLAALAKNTTATRYLSNTGGSNNPAWAQVVLTNGVSGTLPVANGGTGVTADFVPLLRKSVTLTDAQVKALPTTGVTIVVALGAGFYANILAVELLSKFTTAGYTNVNTTYAALSVSINGASYTANVVNDNSTAPAITALTAFMSNTARRVRLPMYLESIGTAAGSDELYTLPYTANGTTLGLDTTADLDNQAVTINADNNGSGNFTGGNAANTLIVKVYYTVEAIP